MNYEVNLINAIVESGSITEAFENRIDSMFLVHGDVWAFVKDFYDKYERTPTKEVLNQNFKDFPIVKADSPVQYYIDEAKREFQQVKLRQTLVDAAERLKEDSDPGAIIAHMQSDLMDIARSQNKLKDTNISDYDERLELLEDRINNPEHDIIGVTSGFSVIDTFFGGWQPGDFVVVIGWTGVGKSAITRKFAANAWTAGYVPLIISLEMDRIQEQYRMDTFLNDGRYFTNQQLTSGKDIDLDIYKKFVEETYGGKQPIHLVTSDGIDSADVPFVQAKIEQYKPDMVILDYHTLFDAGPGGGNETEKAKKLSQEFKRTAMKYRVPIIDVSGVTMEDGHDERPPELNEIAWSKQLSYDADLVLAIHRPPESNTFQIQSRKTRRCSPFAFYMNWDLNTGECKEIFERGGF